MKKSIILFSATSLSLDMVFAQVRHTPIQIFLSTLQILMVQVLPFVVGVAILFFIYGFGKYIIKRNKDGDAVRISKQIMMYSGVFILISISVMIFIWVTLVLRMNHKVHRFGKL